MNTETGSLIAVGTTVNGGVSGTSELNVEGVIRGPVSVTRLVVGETGQVEGAIQAEQVEARGKIVGSIAAKQVRLLAGCRVEGDVSHEVLTVEADAVFEGRSQRLQRPAPTLVTKIEDLKAAAGY